MIDYDGYDGSSLDDPLAPAKGCLSGFLWGALVIGVVLILVLVIL